MSLSHVTGLGLYSYATLSNAGSYAGSHSSGHSREPSSSRRLSLPTSSYPTSMHSRALNSTDSRADPYSYPRTSESSHATRATSVNAASVNEEAMRRNSRKKHNYRETSGSSSEQHRHHGYHRHSHHAYHSHHPSQREDRYNSESTKARRRVKHVQSSSDIPLSPPPARKKITKKPSDATETKPRRKSKWKFWAKQEPYVEVTEAGPLPLPPKTLEPKFESDTKVRSSSRTPSITEWLGQDPSVPQSPTALKRLFEEEE
ncbi:uncharacterized protein B0J16DRAFT_298343 [Fusarium flagelliforme]|uniref:uncharacterized protein n=1 Tax=Fusarium flagelliforme TaxID=2675880 RepID=UPI001E8D142C|nr:uncharacterized protein B0J16DRAFT_298343 [Fusarium flagelliforme]KAH7198706.1 hypothetical protein B0J16DRAFT_298343 [Fusarium flagelliforme]